MIETAFLLIAQLQSGSDGMTLRTGVAAQGIRYIMPTFHKDPQGNWLYPKEGEEQYYVPVGRDRVEREEIKENYAESSQSPLPDSGYHFVQPLKPFKPSHWWARILKGNAHAAKKYGRSNGSERDCNSDVEHPTRRKFRSTFQNSREH
jgi:hypothetical protein